MIDLTTIEARITLAKKYATIHELDPVLVCAVAENESSWNSWSTRYEPGFFHKYIESMNLPGGEAYMRATSWGLMQIMGQTARELGFEGKFLSSLCDPDLGLEFGCRKLKKCLEAKQGDVVKALLMYNGGGDIHYPDRVIGRMPKYSTVENK
jgi:hypothetical protein